MESFESEALILAGTHSVWDILTDAGNYAVWESGIVAVSGEMRSGGRVRIRTRGDGRRSFRVRVELTPRRLMTWTAGLPLGLAKVTRTFTLTDYTGITHLTVRDTAAGPLRRLARKSGPGASVVLTAFVEAVRFRAELPNVHLDDGFPAPFAHERANVTASGGRPIG
jgi:hypothetical protein